MKKNKITRTTKILTVFILIMMMSLQVFNQEEGLTFIKSVFNSKYQFGTTITSLDTPTNLKWKEDSTATATWDKVENANYYSVNVYIFDIENNLLATKETGTTNNELDVQQEINSISSIDSYDEIKISFDVIANFYNDILDISSSVSQESDKILYKNYAGKKRLKGPSNIFLSDDYILSFDIPEDEDISSYRLSSTMIYEGGYLGSFGDGYLYESEMIKEGTRRSANIEDILFETYSNYWNPGEPVEIYYSIEAYPVDSSKYKPSMGGALTNKVTYVSEGKKRLKGPTNIFLSDDYILSFDIPEDEEISSYILNSTMIYEGGQLGSFGDGYLYESEMIKEGTRRSANIEDILFETYSNYWNPGEPVEIYYSIEAYPVDSSKYKPSLGGALTNKVTYVSEGKKREKVPAATNITLSDDYVISFDITEEENISSYYLNSKIEYKGNIYYLGGGGYLNKENLIKDGTKRSANVEQMLFDTYSQLGDPNAVLKISFYVESQPIDDNKYSSNCTYEYSNPIYYTPKGSTVINDIELSPNKPIIAVGRSIYIGKTITPSNSFYDYINWSTSDKDTVSITDMGQITGIKKGKATITAQINNATQDAEVYVYEIKTCIDIFDEIKNVIDKANDIIESIIGKKDTKDTDTDTKEVDKVIEEIYNGAVSGNMFNVDLKYEEKAKDVFDNYKDKIEDKFKDFNIAGGNDIRVEISHTDKDNKEHHITNITEFDDTVSLDFDITNIIPKQEKNTKREYKLVRKHNDDFEELNFEIKDNKIKTKTNKFSDFILLYKDTEIENLIPLNPELESQTLNSITLKRLDGYEYSIDGINFQDNNVFNNLIPDVEYNFYQRIKETETTFASQISESLKVTISRIDISKCNFNYVNEYIYTGTSIIPKVEITYGDQKLIENTDYTINYQDNINVGVATIIITGTGGYINNTTLLFKINENKLINISLNKTNGSLKVGETENLTVTYNPTNTSDDKTIIWSSSDNSITKIENGTITALKVGEVTITAKVGEKTATYKVTVIAPEKLQEEAAKKGFKIKNHFIHGFKLESLITDVKNTIGLNVRIDTNNTIIATGIQFNYNDETFTSVVYGDLNGDGKINSADLLKMRQHLLGTNILTGAYKEAGSIATGTTINSADLLRIRQHLLGQKLIEQ